MHPTLNNYRRISDYCTRHLETIKTIQGFEQAVNLFQLKLAEAEANRLLADIANPETATIRLNIKECLCTLAAGIANALLLSGKLKSSSLFREPANYNRNILFHVEDKILIGRCLILHQTAREHLTPLADGKLSASAMNTLKMLTDIWETTAEPTPRAITGIASHYAQRVARLLADAATILTTQLDAFVVEAAINEKAFGMGYFRLRASG
jgi:hypothetical protein